MRAAGFEKIAGLPISKYVRATKSPPQAAPRPRGAAYKKLDGALCDFPRFKFPRRGNAFHEQLDHLFTHPFCEFPRQGNAFHAQPKLCKIKAPPFCGAELIMELFAFPVYLRLRKAANPSASIPSAAAISEGSGIDENAYEPNPSTMMLAISPS